MDTQSHLYWRFLTCVTSIVGEGGVSDRGRSLGSYWPIFVKFNCEGPLTCPLNITYYHMSLWLSMATESFPTWQLLTCARVRHVDSGRGWRPLNSVRSCPIALMAANTAKISQAVPTDAWRNPGLGVESKFLSLFSFLKWWLLLDSKNLNSLYPILNFADNDLPRYNKVFLSKKIEGNGRDQCLSSLYPVSR